MSAREDKPTVIFYPSFGHPIEQGRAWHIHVSGVVFEPGVIDFRKRILLRVLQRVMRVPHEAFETEIFRQRIRGFVAATERGRQIAIRLGDRTYVLPRRCKRNGHFVGSLRLEREQVQQLHADGAIRDGWLNFHSAADQLVPPDGIAPPGFAGRVQLIEPHGVSVVSDIDDTIKHTDVTCRRELLANTFLRRFEPIDGMASLYHNWCDQGAVFHYVSSSPWQLFSPLAEFGCDAGFPQGTYHLRAFRLRDHMLRRVFLVRRRGKGVAI